MTKRIVLILCVICAAGCSSLTSELRDLESEDYADRKEAILALAARLKTAKPGEIPEGDRSRALDGIRGGLHDSSAMVRSVAVGRLESLLDRTSAYRIAPLLKDRSWLVRLTAIQALRTLEAKGAEKALAEILRSDPNVHCRREAAMTIGALRSRLGVEACIAALEERETDPNVQHAAWEALMAISGKDLPRRARDWQVWWETEGNRGEGSDLDD